MRERDVIDIGLRVIKRCGMYSEECKNWIAHESKSPPIVKSIDSFKEYWSGAIALINQMAALASQPVSRLWKLPLWTMEEIYSY